MRTSVAFIITLSLATAVTGCGSSDKSASPTTTATAAATQATRPPGIKYLCAQRTRNVLLKVQALGPNATLQYDGKSPFYKALVLSLNDCSTHTEWSSAITVQGPGATAAFLGAVFRRGCAAEKLTAHPIPAACKNP